MLYLPGGTITLLFTDMEGSKCLLQQLGERYQDVMEECRQLLGNDSSIMQINYDDS